ncbi:hypothetical protein BDP81DRAFT_401268 [Colletotrichum phormii]|uniref:Uncharacterized protein n=1 Tax=Colletotrichum phormii TaxID=359342 RepID=A0AAJ0E756_9PEZI|nr:uncharacterized protein BDP81DRAFT_401268 [Colletotrichum phormii]KAK1613479.1 hypothetical protein BDP81DRAFT_401268 [Colletotrichum phormii]
MKSSAYFVIVAATFGLAEAQCNANNCARAVTGTRLGPATQAVRRADCSSYQRTTITRYEQTASITVTSPASFDVTRTLASSTVTITTTVPLIIIIDPVQPSFSIDLPEIPIITSPSGFRRRDLEGRQLVSSSAFAPIPAYASACSGASAYRSACSCWGITPSFVTASVPGTTTLTITSLYVDTVTVIGTDVTTTTALHHLYRRAFRHSDRGIFHRLYR